MKWHTAKYGNPYSKFVLCIYPSKVHTHSSEHTYTHPEQWAAIYAAAPGEQLGVGALFKGTSVVVLRVERALYIHSPHLQSLPDWDLNSQPLDYKSDSLTIRPRLPTMNWLIMTVLTYQIFWYSFTPFSSELFHGPQQLLVDPSLKTTALWYNLHIMPAWMKPTHKTLVSFPAL